MKLLTATRLAYTLKGELPPNEDENGVHFGVINSNDETLNADAVQEIFDKGVNLNTEEIVSDEIEKVVNLIMKWAADGYPKDPAEEMAKASFHAYADGILPDLHGKIGFPWVAERVREVVTQHFDRDAFLDEAGNDFDLGDSSLLYEEDGYKILKAADGDLFIEKSPYYALRGYCSPCAPNAGHHKSDGGVPTYVLGSEWYEDGKMPYECKPVGEYNKETS